MQSYNTITCAGHIINPESKVIETSNGTRHMLTWSMAFNDPMDRNNKEKTSWVRVVAWGKPAEIIEQYCTEIDPTSGNLVAQRGAAVVVTGTLAVQKWVNRQGQTGTTVQVTVQQFQLIGSNNTLTGEQESSPSNGNGRRPVANTNTNNRSRPAAVTAAAKQPTQPEEVDLEEVPF